MNIFLDHLSRDTSDNGIVGIGLIRHRHHTDDTTIADVSTLDDSRPLPHPYMVTYHDIFRLIDSYPLFIIDGMPVGCTDIGRDGKQTVITNRDTVAILGNNMEVTTEAAVLSDHQAVAIADDIDRIGAVHIASFLDDDLVVGTYQGDFKVQYLTRLIYLDDVITSIINDLNR